MAELAFFEKPGCATNSRQKQWLRNAGIAFEAKSLLSEPWTREQLLNFFGALPVTDWFNRAAPRIRSGAIDPATLDADAALQLMLEEPLLIRRPLLQCGDWYRVGFDADAIAAQWQLSTASVESAQQNTHGALEGCSHGDRAHAAACATPAAESAS